MNIDKTRLSYWLPRLQAAGLPTPRTIIIYATKAEYKDIYRLLDGEKLQKPGKTLISRITAAADEMGYPCFLRTDHTSAKHDWEKTCFLQKADDVEGHAAVIINFWECVNFSAPPCDVWVIREFLPTIPAGVCENYNNMPICKEFRFFVDGPEVKCWHPYWPLEVLEQGAPRYYGSFDYEEFCRTVDIEGLHKLASAAGAAAGGEWSVDILETRQGWYITDMAEAHKSWHWKGCPKQEGGV